MRMGRGRRVRRRSCWTRETCSERGTLVRWHPRSREQPLGGFWSKGCAPGWGRGSESDI